MGEGVWVWDGGEKAEAKSRVGKKSAAKMIAKSYIPTNLWAKCTIFSIKLEFIWISQKKVVTLRVE